MRRILTLLAFVMVFSLLAQEEDEKYLEYNFSEFFQMIEESEDSIFTLKNAQIVLDTLVDQAYFTKYGTAAGYQTPKRQDTIHIRKAVNLENVFLDPYYNGTIDCIGLIHNVVFHENVTLRNVFGEFQNCHFKETTRVWFTENVPEMLLSNFGKSRFERFHFQKCVFEKDPRIISFGGFNEASSLTFLVDDCVFKSNPIGNGSWISLSDFNRVTFSENIYEGADALAMLFYSNNQISIEGNDISNRWTSIHLGGEDNGEVGIVDNRFGFALGLKLSESIPNLTMDWNQLGSGVFERDNFFDFVFQKYEGLEKDSFEAKLFDREEISLYRESIRITNNKYFKAEMRLLGILTSVYKRQHDTQSSNASFIALKDLETERLAYLYGQDPSFGAFFEWKVNQFLKLFSDYGTKPSKAIVMSVYVILAFALIYLFFPNHWDSHGRMRIMDRLRFFLKYSKQEEGAKEVYLEEKNEELVPFEEFKTYFEEHGKKAPGFFYAIAMPLYKWSVSGTRLVSGMLGKVDVLKGTWENTPKSQRWLKSSLVIGAFLFAFLYDLFIKILNAVMLSINTFTTLGFGEIPIKGLPRYLAIIQGFIGWFMLTIFSVSLISQLLN